jgi:hypothetical protein
LRPDDARFSQHAIYPSSPGLRPGPIA